MEFLQQKLSGFNRGKKKYKTFIIFFLLAQMVWVFIPTIPSKMFL